MICACPLHTPLQAVPVVDECSFAKSTSRKRKHAPHGTLIVAMHEVAHAVARLVLDEALPHPGPQIRRVTVEPKGLVLGSVEMDPRAWDAMRAALGHHAAPPHLGRNLAFDMVELVAGPAATVLQQLGRVGLETFIEHRLDSPCFCDLDPCDHSRARAKAEWLAADAGCEVYRRAWRVAAALVLAEWPAITRLARLLRDERTFDGETFENLWRTVRQGVQARNARAKRYGWASLDDELAAYLATARRHSVYPA